MKEIINKEEMELLTLLETSNLDLNKKKAKALLTHKRVKVNGKVISQYNHMVKKGSKVNIDFTNKKAPEDLEILYEDKEIIVLNKKAGLLTIATNHEKEKTLYYMVRDYVKSIQKNNTIFSLHRLDKDTSGIVVFAKNEKVKHIMQTNWDKLVLKRGYIAIVHGILNKKEGSIHSYLTEGKNYMVYSTTKEKGKSALTKYKVILESANYSMLDIEIETGRKNQIRVHMKELGHSIIGDKKYGLQNEKAKRLYLHAHELVLKHPITKKNLVFKINIPKEFKNLLKDK